MKQWQHWVIWGSSMVLCSLAWGQPSSAMVLRIQGDVVLELPDKAQSIEPLIRLLEGDRVRLAPGAHIRLLYARSGLQEDWQDAGVLRINSTESSIVRGQPRRETRQLPLAITQQMARTPRSDSTARIGGVRLRRLPSSAPPPGQEPPTPPVSTLAPETSTGASSTNLATLEENYQSLRHNTAADDHNPEVYFLAGLWDLGAHERLRHELQRLQGLHPHDPVIMRLHTLYAGVLPSSAPNMHKPMPTPRNPTTEDAGK
ncbi:MULTISPECIES: hypothetical protein [Giesbergeria]|uniref:Uncharacterized protein n=1 Tax=Giesbergeria sinuosa TaxID=80883 RepID=A0ABV9Q9X6_9BURK